jgi:hypothetical protein
VNCKKCLSSQSQRARGKAKLLEHNAAAGVRTEHVSKFILTTALLTNVCRDTEIHDEVCLIRELLRIQAANEQEADAIDEAFGQSLQLAAQGRERERLLRNTLKGEVEACARVYQYSFELEGEGGQIIKSAMRMDDLAQSYLQSCGRLARAP